VTDGPRCRGCKRRLKHPSPSGYGPVCERRINGASPGRAPAVARPRAATEPIDGQTELDLYDQPALWPV
jgi:hypothetical protein